MNGLLRYISLRVRLYPQQEFSNSGAIHSAGDPFPNSSIVSLQRVKKVGSARQKSGLLAIILSITHPFGIPFVAHQWILLGKLPGTAFRRAVDMLLCRLFKLGFMFFGSDVEMTSS